MDGGSSHSLGTKGLSERPQTQHLPALLLGSALVETRWPLAGVCWPHGVGAWGAQRGWAPDMLLGCFTQGECCRSGRNSAAEGCTGAS